MKPYSMDLRQRIVEACAQGATDTAVAERYGVCTKTVQRYRQRAGQGQLVPRSAPGAPPRISKEQEVAFLALVREHPSFTLEQYVQEWERRTGVALPLSTLHRHLRRLDGRYKKRA